MSSGYDSMWGRLRSKKSELSEEEQKRLAEIKASAFQRPIINLSCHDEEDKAKRLHEVGYWLGEICVCDQCLTYPPDGLLSIGYRHILAAFACLSYYDKQRLRCAPKSRHYWIVDLVGACHDDLVNNIYEWNDPISYYDPEPIDITRAEWIYTHKLFRQHHWMKYENRKILSEFFITPEFSSGSYVYIIQEINYPYFYIGSQKDELRWYYHKMAVENMIMSNFMFGKQTANFQYYMARRMVEGSKFKAEIIERCGVDSALPLESKIKKEMKSEFLLEGRRGAEAIRKLVPIPNHEKESIEWLKENNMYWNFEREDDE